MNNNNITENITLEIDAYSDFSDWGKLLIVLLVSILFWILCVIIFHFFRQYRKDKLITNKFSMTYKDEIDTDDMYLYLNERGAKELVEQRLSKVSDKSKSKSSKYNHERIKALRKKTKDYSFFGWFKFIYNISDKDVMTVMNAEGYIYIYYQRITAFLFLFLSFFSIFILIPLYLNLLIIQILIIIIIRPRKFLLY